MKSVMSSVLSVICILSMAATCFAAPSGEGGEQQIVYSAAAPNPYNTAQLRLEGTTVQIVRRGDQEPTKPDELSVLRDHVVVLHQPLEWEGEPVDGSLYGYTAELEMGQLADGEYVLRLESSVTVWLEDANGESAGVRTPYTLLTAPLAKQGDICQFPADQRISSRYNSNLLQQLQQGNAPDDFAVLRQSYATAQNSQVLEEIEQRALELTAGLQSDLEKCLAIERWITGNIAYDFDFPRENVDQWLQAHPDDTARQEDPLHAFESGYAMCYGYAKLTTLMLGYVGIDSVYVRGRYEEDVSSDVRGAGLSDSYSSTWNASVPQAWSFQTSDGTEMQDVWNHAWNAVKLSGSWYFLDTCKGAVYGYHRTDSEDPTTAYTQLNQGYSGVYLFPSVGQISTTHMAIRYGADEYGIKIGDA